VIGVVGAGTMGSGIAQLAARAGARTLLHDPLPDALARGAERARGGLQKEAAKGRLSPEQAAAAGERLLAAEALEALAECDLVIEAAPERLELKHELYRRLGEIVSSECVLATNTSSLLVTAIASAASQPERVVGMHFFNPAPVMRLLEVVAGEQSDERSLALAHATGEAMGKTVIRAHDGPGFLVNRCNRPFGLEALRLLQERIADVETIDRIVRTEGGFRMGPFELMDLVGVDTGFEISRSFYEQSFHEPRWRPSPITARYVAAGRYGRKSGRGYYDYSRDPYRPPDLDPPAPPADEVGARVSASPSAQAGVGVSASPSAQAGVGVSASPSAQAGVGVSASPGTKAASPGAQAAAEATPAAAGVLERILCQVINECAFALGEGVGSAQDIDTGMVLGLNYPRGPLGWADEIGLDRVLAVLDGLWEEYREERYRAAPTLRRLASEGRLGHAAGAGFFEYRSPD
jgi:3-hydroxybutyryl-CoA dehydrogenase